MDSIKVLFGSALGIVFMLSATLGWAYWMWMAIQIGSLECFSSAFSALSQ